MNTYKTNSSFHSVELSISKKHLNCLEIAKYLKTVGIMASITPNTTVVCNQHKCKLENGCRILLNDCDKQIIKEKIWEPIKNKNQLNCAHIKIPNTFSGCIYDYLRDSNCPG
tara:strand:- start:155 stop:490 length:336 start_codon:yes stop_codon:yes gene_type:complete